MRTQTSTQRHRNPRLLGVTLSLLLGVGSIQAAGPNQHEPGVGRKISNFFKGLVGKDEPPRPYYAPPPAHQQRQGQGQGQGQNMTRQPHYRPAPQQPRRYSLDMPPPEARGIYDRPPVNPRYQQAPAPQRPTTSSDSNQQSSSQRSARSQNRRDDVPQRSSSSSKPKDESTLPSNKPSVEADSNTRSKPPTPDQSKVDSSNTDTLPSSVKNQEKKKDQPTLTNQNQHVPNSKKETSPTNVVASNPSTSGSNSSSMNPSGNENNNRTTAKDTTESASSGTSGNTASNASTPSTSGPPTGTKTDKPGRVKSPYPPFNELDVTGLETGSLAMDPTTQKVFRVP